MKNNLYLQCVFFPHEQIKDSSCMNHHNLNKGKGHNDDRQFGYESSAMIIAFWMISLVSNKELFCLINRKVSCSCGKC